MTTQFYSLDMYSLLIILKNKLLIIESKDKKINK